MAWLGCFRATTSVAISCILMIRGITLIVALVPGTRSKDRLSSSLVDNTETLSPVRSFYTSFNEIVHNRTVIADLIAIDSASLVGEKLPHISLGGLVSMLGADTKREQKRRKFSRDVARSGGSCLIRLDCNDAIDQLNGMWDCIHEIFSVKDRQKMNIHHQSLSRDDQLDVKTGYDYVHLSLESVAQIRDSLGDKITDEALAAFHLLSSVGRVFSAAVYSGISGSTPDDTSNLIAQLIHDESQSCNGSFQRLAQYAHIPGGTTGSCASLRAHCDWSLATLVPVSHISGLELYNPLDQSWTRPEVVAHQYAKRHQREGDARWNSRYVVVMAGKWLELLCNGKVESAIHRVVSQPGAASRPSAPFFLRPLPKVSDDAEALTFEDIKSVPAGIHYMSEFLSKSAPMNEDR